MFLATKLSRVVSNTSIPLSPYFWKVGKYLSKKHLHYNLYLLYCTFFASSINWEASWEQYLNSLIYVLVMLAEYSPKKHFHCNFSSSHDGNMNATLKIIAHYYLPPKDKKVALSTTSIHTLSLHLSKYPMVAVHTHGKVSCIKVSKKVWLVNLTPEKIYKCLIGD